MSHRSHVRRIALARGISLAGSEAAFIALIAALYERTGSTTWVSAALVAGIGVRGLVAPLSGAIADRFDRRRVMVASDLGAAICFAAFVLTDEPAVLVGLMALASLCEAPFFPASSAAIPNLVPAARLVWANATMASSSSVGRVAGPLAGGLLVAVVGADGAFVANCVSFFASAALVASVRGRFTGARDGDDAHRGPFAGFALVRRDRTLLTLTAAWTVALLFVGVILVAEYPLADSFGTGSVGYGAVLSTWAVGVIGGAWLAQRALRHRSEAVVCAVGALIMGVALSAVSISPLFAPIVALQLCGGIGNGLTDVAETTLVQARAPDAVRSRVFAALEALALTAFGISFAVGGPLVDALGPQPAYAIGGLGCILAAGLLATIPRDAVRRRTPVGAAAGD